MATVTHEVGKAFVLKTTSVVFTRDGATDSDDFSKHIGEVAFTPSVQTGTWTGVSGNVISDQGIATWTTTFGLIQDLADNGFLRWLLIHEGEKADAVVTFADGADPCTVTVTLSPAQIGGAVGANPLSSSVTMATDGKPNFAA